MFANRRINDIHATRYIISWIKEGGQLYYLSDVDNFRQWLLSLGVNKDDADHIVFLAMQGKLELETSARNWLSNMTH